MQLSQRNHGRKGAVVGLFVFLCLILAVPLVSGSYSWAESAKGPVGEDKEAPDTQVLVTYFYTSYRCPTCRKLETFSRQAIEEGFPRQLAEKKIVFRALNLDEPENSRYIQDYKLVTKSLIVSSLEKGKEVKWKNLPDIWKLVGDEQEFKEYVRKETKNFLEQR
jgi:hypothetical protein